MEENCVGYTNDIVFTELKTNNDETIRYSYIPGNNKSLYFRACTGKFLATYENMYLSVAKRLHEKYGCSVLCCSHPVLMPGDFDKGLIENFVKNHNIANPELFFLGHAKGCITGLKLATEGIKFKKLVIVNARLRDERLECVKLVKRLPNSQIVVVHDMQNPSYIHLPIFEEQNFKNVEMIKAHDIYHSFKCAIDSFELCSK